MTAKQAGRPAVNFVLRDLRIQDFRALRNVCLRLASDTTVLLGPNNSGKTSVLEALATVFGARLANEDDLHISEDGNQASAFVVDARFEPRDSPTVDPDTRNLLGDAIRPPGADGKDFFVLRTVGAPSPEGGGLSLRRSFLQNWECDPIAAAAVPDVPRVRNWRQALELVEFTFLDARRDIVADLRNRTSTWGKLVANLGLTAELTAEVEAKLTDLSSKVVDGSAVLKALAEALTRVKQSMTSGVDKVSVHPLPGRVEDLSRSIDVLVTAPGSAPVPMRMQGMGGRSLSALTVFGAFVELRLGLDRPVDPLPLSAIEEPEAHLHPQAQKAVIRHLSRIQGQKLISTHSPYLASVADVRDLRVLRRAGAEVTVRSVSANLSNPELLAVRRFVQRRNGEVLFAGLAILYEGHSEDAALAVFASNRWTNPSAEAQGVSFVNAEGAGGYKAIVPVIEGLGIPWLMLCDGDHAGIVGLASVSAVLGRVLDATSAEIVVLPNAWDFEAALVNSGLDAEIEAGIAGYYGATALGDYRAANQGRKGTDYNAVGGQTRLLDDFLSSNKGSYGGPVAQAIAAAGKTLPSIDELFKRADSLLPKV